MGEGLNIGCNGAPVKTTQGDPVKPNVTITETEVDVNRGNDFYINWMDYTFNASHEDYSYLLTIKCRRFFSDSPDFTRVLKIKYDQARKRHIVEDNNADLRYDDCIRMLNFEQAVGWMIEAGANGSSFNDFYRYMRGARSMINCNYGGHF